MLVTIRNKKTGETKQVESSQLGEYGLGTSPTPSVTQPTTTQPTTSTPTTSGTDVSLNTLYKALQDDLTKTGGKNASKITNLINVFNEKKKIETPDPDIEEAQKAEKETQNYKKQTTELVDELLGRDTGAITGVKNPFKSLTGENQYTKNLVDQLTSRLSIDGRSKLKGSGQISDYESQLLAKSVSALNTNLSNADFQRELTKIRAILAPDEDVEIPESKKGDGFIDRFIVNPYKRTATNIATVGQVGASSLIGKFDPQLGAEIASKNIKFGLDEGTLDQAAKASGTTSDKFGLVLTQVLDSIDIAGQAKILKGMGVNVDLGQLSKGKFVNPSSGNGIIGKFTGAKPDVAGKVVKVGEKVESLSPKNILGNKQRAAAQTYKNIKPDFSDVKSTIKDLSEVDPDVAKLAPKYIKTLDKVKDIPTLLDRMQKWGRMAYTKGGSIKSTAKADVFKTLYEGGNTILKTQAPEVAKYRSLLRFSFELPAAAGKLLWKATLGKVIGLY